MDGANEEAARVAANRRSSFGRKLKTNTRLDDLEDAAIKKLSSRKQRKLKEAEEKKMKASKPQKKRKAKQNIGDGEELNPKLHGEQEDTEETDEEEADFEVEEETTSAVVAEPSEEQERKKHTPYTSRRRKGRLGSSQEKLSVGEDSEGEREVEEKKGESPESSNDTGEPPQLQQECPDDFEECNSRSPPTPQSDQAATTTTEETKTKTKRTEKNKMPLETIVVPDNKELAQAVEEDTTDLAERDSCVLESQPEECASVDIQPENEYARATRVEQMEIETDERVEAQRAPLTNETVGNVMQPQDNEIERPDADMFLADSSNPNRNNETRETSTPATSKPSTSGLASKRRRGRPKKEENDDVTEDLVSANDQPSVEAASAEEETAEYESSSASVQVVATSAAVPVKKTGNITKKTTKDTYYCKHCETNFPVGFFRNVQQFGAHCSNCSRGRALQAPDDSYATRLPTRLQRALKRKKRQEENGGVPRKRGRKAHKSKSEPRPQAERQRQQKRQKVHHESRAVEVRTQRRERKPVTHYDDAYVYNYHEKRYGREHSTPRRRDWEDRDASRVRRRHLSQRLLYMPMTVNRVEELPQKLLLRIFSFLDKAGDLAKVGMACKLFGRIYNHDSLWKRLFCKEWGESLGYAFVGNWKVRFRARIQYIESRKRPAFLPSLRLDSQTQNAATPTPDNSSNLEGGSFCSLPPAKSTPLPSHGHWLAEKIVDSQPKTDPVTGKSRMEYLIKWEGFGDDWNSWINEEDVWCKELVEEYTSGKITVPPSQKARHLQQRMRQNSHTSGASSWGGSGSGAPKRGSEGSDEEWYRGAKRKTAGLAGWGTGGKGHLFSSGYGEDEYGSLWDLDMDEDLWRDTWDNGSTTLMSDDEDEEEEYEEVPVTKEEKEKQQTEFLRALDANANYKPVILFFEKS